MSDLDDKTIKMLTWKPQVCRDIAVAIVRAVLKSPTIWPDEVGLGFVQPADKNCIGVAWRRLKNNGIISHGTAFRRSKSEGAAKRTIFCYTLANRTLAEKFLALNAAPVVPRQPTFVGLQS